jgi:hypothetical protein
MTEQETVIALNFKKALQLLRESKEQRHSANRRVRPSFFLFLNSCFYWVCSLKNLYSLKKIYLIELEV